MRLALPVFVLAAFGITGCADWKPSGSATSPNGKTVAQIEVALAGASSSNRTRVVIKNGKGGSLPKPIYVVEADGAIVDRTNLRWTDANRLLVTLCDATNYRVESRTLGEPTYVDAGRGDGTGVENAIWVDVVNLNYSDDARSCLPRDKVALDTSSLDP